MLDIPASSWVVNNSAINLVTLVSNQYTVQCNLTRSNLPAPVVRWLDLTHLDFGMQNTLVGVRN